MPTEETMSSDVKPVVAACEMEIEDIQNEKEEKEKEEKENNEKEKEEEGKEQDEQSSDNIHRIEVAEQQDQVKKDEQEIGFVNTAF